MPGLRLEHAALIVDTALARGRTHGMLPLTVVVLDVANPFFTDVVRGAEPLIESAGGVVTVCDSGEDVRRERRHLGAPRRAHTISGRASPLRSRRRRARCRSQPKANMVAPQTAPRT